MPDARASRKRQIRVRRISVSIDAALNAAARMPACSCRLVPFVCDMSKIHFEPEKQGFS
jgi:hypothetical protein